MTSSLTDRVKAKLFPHGAKWVLVPQPLLTQLLACVEALEYYANAEYYDGGWRPINGDTAREALTALEESLK